MSRAAADAQPSTWAVDRPGSSVYSVGHHHQHVYKEVSDVDQPSVSYEFAAVAATAPERTDHACAHVCSADGWHYAEQIGTSLSHRPQDTRLCQRAERRAPFL